MDTVIVKIYQILVGFYIRPVWVTATELSPDTDVMQSSPRPSRLELCQDNVLGREVGKREKVRSGETPSGLAKTNGGQKERN